ncbi:MAG: hypothetical protein IJ751_03345, partial [Oscillospiraceae bacterium]|nr:hypothetical protein [Oscillospiraceae bacterium]
SQWETTKGYPSIASLQALSDLFGVSIDALIADDDIENHRLLEQAQGRKNYWLAMACLAAATGSALLAYFTGIPYFGIISSLGVIGYIVFGLLSKPKYKRLSMRKMILPYVLSRLVILAVVVFAIIAAFQTL